MLWAKHYVGMVTDDKFAAAAEIAAVSPLLPPVLFSSLFERAAENGDGTITGFQPRVFAAKFRVGLDEVTRTLAAFAELAIVVADRLVNWAKRQGVAAVDAVKTAVAKVHGATARRVSTPRVRKHRHRQGELLLPIAGALKHPDEMHETHETPDETRFMPTEEERERSLEGSPQVFNQEEGDSRRCAPLQRSPPGEAKAKRKNMITTLRRWSRLSPRLDEDERLPRLQMLDRAEFALDAWDARSIEDKRCFDILAARARASPLDDQVILWVRRAETPQQRAGGLRPLGYVLNGGRNGYPEPDISQMQRS